MFFRADKGFARADRGFVADQIADGAELLDDGALLFPDGTRQRPGVEAINHGEVAAGVTIAHGGSRAAMIVIRILETTGNVTMTALPNIEAGTFDGQALVLIVDKDSGFTVTVQDETGLAGSGIRTNAAAVLIGGARDTSCFTWSAEDNAWTASFGSRVNNI